MGENNHLITTDDTFMVAVGLSSFTTGTLYDWVTESDGYNLQYLKISEDLLGALKKDFRILSISDIKKRKATSAFPIMDILIGKSDSSVDGDQYNFTNYRKQNRNTIDINFVNIIENSSFNNWTYNFDNFSYDSSTLNIDSADLFTDTSYEDQRVSKLIILNDIVSAPGYLNTPTTDEKKARYRFIRDIKTSVSGCVTWSAPEDSIVFYDGNSTTDDDGNVSYNECSRPVNYKLFLYGNQNSKIDELSVALPHINIVDNKRNEFGVIHNGLDGELRRVPVTDNEPTSKVGGKVKTHYNEYNKQFEAGTTQVMAVMETNLEAATPPDIGLISSPTDYDSFDTGFSPTFGTARPITMKNGNPFKWGPEWKYSAGCTDDEKAKVFTVPVQNKFPNLSFGSGEMVILNKIGGVWQPMGAESTVTPPTITTQVTNWDFMYMVSNAKNYFINSDEDTNIRFDTYEQAFYNMYYDGDVSSKELDHNTNGYVQLTSFDFMGPSIGGLRNGHALGNTLWGQDINGNTVSDPTDRNSFETAPFFGCVFPNGYDADKVAFFKNAIATGITTNSDWSSYMRQTIDAGTLVFDDSQNANKLYNLFDSTDPKLSNLPADIALNANPNSTIGSPLTILKEVEKAFKKSDETVAEDIIVDVQDRVTNFLINEDSRIAYYKNQDGTSAFEFQPENAKQIQFRPLKVEVYATFEIQDGDVLITDEDTRGVFGSEAWRTVDDGESPIATNVLSRTNANTLEGGVIGNYTGIAPIRSGFLYNKDISDAALLPSSNSAFPVHYWMYDWQIPGGRPAGAVGIIGASCKVAALTSITFQAQCFIGMRSAFISSASVNIFGFDFINNAFSDAYGDGGFTDRPYYGFNNTTLQVRVYQSWPKKQTIYDPRYFAVYHFSAGAGESITQKWYSSEGNEITEEEYDELDPALRAYKTGSYIVDQLTHPGTDFRVPTLIGPDDDSIQFLGVLPEVNDEVYSDGVNGDNTKGSWRDYNDWLVDIGARGKLLPTKNIFRIDIGVLNGDVENGDQIVIDNHGSGYKEGDVFTTRGGNGSGVTLIIKTIEDDKIKEFTITGFGTGFLPKDFFSSSEENKNYISSVVKLDPVSTNGTGLNGYIAYGIIYLAETIITGPEKATSESFLTLSANPPAPDNDRDTARGPLNEERNETAIIVNPSEDNQYDLFFHYHNDISHCFVREWGVMPTKEQAITLVISSL